MTEDLTITSVTVYKGDVNRLWKLRRRREYVPERKDTNIRPGRPFSGMETMADLFKRAVDALEALE